MEKNRKPRGAKGTTREKRPGRLPLFAMAFQPSGDKEHARFSTFTSSPGYCPKPLYQSECSTGVPGGKDRPGTLEYVAKLTAFHAQFNAVGTNYNQVVKGCTRIFREENTRAAL